MSNAIGAGVSHITLVGSNQNNSPVWSEEAGKPSQSHAWAPYGHGDIDHPGLGFNGERIDPVSHTYHLGNGYRAYNPALMRFNCPDSLSPFGPGGINPYAYCAGDPINHTDPSGHISVSAGIGIGLGVVGILGGLFALFTSGMSIGVAGAVASGLSGAADATGIGGLVAAGLEAAADGLTMAEGIEAAAIAGGRAALVTGAQEGARAVGKKMFNTSKIWQWQPQWRTTRANAWSAIAGRAPRGGIVQRLVNERLNEEQLAQMAKSLEHRTTYPFNTNSLKGLGISMAGNGAKQLHVPPPDLQGVLIRAKTLTAGNYSQFISRDPKELKSILHSLVGETLASHKINLNEDIILAIDHAEKMDANGVSVAQHIADTFHRTVWASPEAVYSTTGNSVDYLYSSETFIPSFPNNLERLI